MPEQNQPIQGNFGGIYQTQTPYLDRVTQQLQQNYANRQSFLQKESQQTDELLNKEMTNVRSIDTPDVIDAYNQYKSLKQNQLFNKTIQQNPKLYAQAQMQANAAYASVMSMINKSAQLNAIGKQIAANRVAKPDAYSDNTGGMLSQLYNTPMDKVTTAVYNGKPIDLTNVDNYRYQGGNFDFAKLNQTAAGKPVTHYDNGTTDETGVQTTQHGFQYGNTPLQFRSNYYSGLAPNEAHRGALAAWTRHTPEELNALDAAYQNSPNWQKMGIAPQQLPPYNPADPAGSEATYQAKQYLVGMNPNEVKAAVTTNQGAKTQLQAGLRLKGQEIMENIREGDREKLAGMRHDFKQMDVQAQSQVLDDTVNAMINDAKNSGTYTYKNKNDQVTKQYQLKISPQLLKALAFTDEKGHPIYPDELRVNPDGTVQAIKFKGESVNGTRAVDEANSRTITPQEFKAIVGKTYFGTHEAAKETTPPKVTTKSVTDFRTKYNY